MVRTKGLPARTLTLNVKLGETPPNNTALIVVGAGIAAVALAVVLTR